MPYLRSVLRESDSISIGELAKSEAEEISFHLQSTYYGLSTYG